MLLSTQAHALGFGGLDVSSSLGEPLRAYIKLSDLSPDIGAECFKLVRSDSSSHFAVNLQVEHGSENTGTLNIQSNKPIDDPIVNLTLVAGCNQDLSREYVLLLDPPTSSPEDTSQSLTSPPSQQGNFSQIAQNAKKNGAQHNIQDLAANGLETPKTPKRKKKSKKTPANQSSSSASSTYSASQSISVVTEPSSDTSTSTNNGVNNNEDARLYISNAAGAGATLSLRLEKTLTERLPTEESIDAPMTLNEADMSDEVTAMSKQLNHLRSQIIALQKRNQELEKTSQAKVKKHREDETTDNKWLIYLLITLALLAAIAIAEWLRRKKQRAQLMDEEIAPWVPDEILMNRDSHDAKVVANAVVEKSAANYTPPPSPIVAEVNDDILEQVEVFVAHGRANLAITLLQEYLRENPQRSPAAWLTILDLFKREKMQVEYDEAASQVKRLFNVSVPNFNDPAENDNSSIDDYPQAKEQLEEVWGTPDELNKVNELAYNKRKEPREGFEKNAYLDVLLLRGIAQHRNQAEHNKSEVSYVDDKLFADDDVKSVDTSDFSDAQVIDLETLSASPMQSVPNEEESPAKDNHEIAFDFPELSVPKIPSDDSPASLIKKTKQEVMQEVVSENATKKKSAEKNSEEEDTSKVDKSKPLDFNL